MSKIFQMTLATLLALGLSVFALGQSQASTGNVTGTVTDTNGAVVPNASITIKNKAIGLEKTATANEDGIYTFVLLPPGSYTIIAQAGNFAKTTIDNVAVTVGRATDANITMGVNQVAEEVVITSDAIQATSNVSDAVLNETAISTLPINGRRFQDFVTLTPTAQVDPQRGQISLSGQRGINSNINVDGVDYNQPFFGGIRGGERSNLAFTIPQESIKEFQVIASGYSAEFGRSSGGIVNAVTKSGDNRVRGTAFYLLRPQRLARGNEYTQALQDQRLTAAGVDATLAPTQQQFGGSVGGPIVKDKLFFFGAYEQQRFRAPRQIIFGIPSTFTPPTDAGQLAVLTLYNGLQSGYQLTNDAYAGLGRIDYTINSNNRFNIRYNFSKNNAQNAVSRGETSLDPTTTQALSTNGTEKNRNKIGVAQLVSNFGTKAVNELRLQVAREDRPRESNSTLPQLQTSFATLGATAFLPTTQFDTRYQVADSFTLLAGNHNFKMGGEYSHLYARQSFGFNQFGQYTANFGTSTANITSALAALSNVRTTTPVFLGRFDSAIPRYNRQIGNLQASFKVKELAFFAQDAWRVTQKLTLSYGIRFEQQYNPAPQVSNTQIANVVKNTIFPYRSAGFDPAQIPDSGWQIGPRAGFAYDLSGNGKTVIRGFSGIYYARTPLLVFADSVNNYRTPPGNVSTQLPFAGFSQANFNTFLGTAAGQSYRTITGCDPTVTPLPAACTPNTLYRQFAIVGVNLNNSALNSLPLLSLDQISSIAGALGLSPNPFVGATVTGHAEDFKNPRAFQFGFAVEREISPGFVVGIDFANVHTTRLQRNRDLNLPAPLTAQQYVAFLQANNTATNYNALVTNGTINQILQAGRQYIAIVQPAGLTTTGTSGLVTTRQRPTQAQQGFALGPVQVRDSTAKSLFRELTFRARMSRKWGQLNAFYTLSKSISDDDNERDAGGVAFANPYDLRGEYYASRLDRRHQFVANPVFFIPYGFEVSSAVRLRSGTPLNSTVGGDLNGDNVNNDRAVLVPGVVQVRNFYRNRALFDTDLRVQKGFSFSEQRRIIFSAEFFNVLNRSNILFPNPNTANSSGAPAQYCAVVSQTCGLGGITNTNFLRVRDAATNLILVNNTNPGSQAFQVQLGARLQF